MKVGSISFIQSSHAFQIEHADQIPCSYVRAANVRYMNEDQHLLEVRDSQSKLGNDAAQIEQVNLQLKGRSDNVSVIHQCCSYAKMTQCKPV